MTAYKTGDAAGFGSKLGSVGASMAAACGYDWLCILFILCIYCVCMCVCGWASLTAEVHL